MIWQKRLVITILALLLLIVHFFVISVMQYQLFLPLIIGSIAIFLGFREWGYALGILSSLLFELYSAHPFGILLLSITIGLFVFDMLITYAFKQVALYSYILVYTSSLLIVSLPIALTARVTQADYYSTVASVYGKSGDMALALFLSVVLGTICTSIATYTAKVLRITIRRV